MELRIIPGTKTLEEHLAIYMANEIEKKLSNLPCEVQKKIYKSILGELEEARKREEREQCQA